MVAKRRDQVMAYADAGPQAPIPGRSYCVEASVQGV
jgi:hypothetical protein